LTNAGAVVEEPMTEIEPELYVLRPAFALRIRIAAWAACASFPLCLFGVCVAPFSLSDVPEMVERTPFLTVLMGLNILVSISLSGLFAWYGLRTLRRISSWAVVADQDGLWPAHLSKREALVRWADIVAKRERRLPVRLELVGAEERVLIVLHGQLVGYAELRMRVDAQVAAAPADAKVTSS
jgi:hypothetical protein